MFRHWIGITALIMTAGCAMVTPQPAAPVAKPSVSFINLKQAPSSPNQQLTNTPAQPQTVTANLPDALDTGLNDALYSQYKEWHGTRYRLGGLSKQGVDCSGFVFMTFKSRLGITLPRDTGLQSREGRDVSKKDLQTGDLVFFRTGRYNHVGIYMEDGRFMHASTREGVKISRLGDAYWTRTYWKAKRLELPSNAQLARLQ